MNFINCKINQALMRVMLISLVKAVSEMCSTVFVRVLFVQLKYRLHFQVTTMSGAAVINEIENSRNVA